jgi:hypothetical protein
MASVQETGSQPAARPRPEAAPVSDEADTALRGRIGAFFTRDLISTANMLEFIEGSKRLDEDGDERDRQTGEEGDVDQAVADAVEEVGGLKSVHLSVSALCAAALTRVNFSHLQNAAAPFLLIIDTPMPNTDQSDLSIFDIKVLQCIKPL